MAISLCLDKHCQQSSPIGLCSRLSYMFSSVNSQILDTIELWRVSSLREIEQLRGWIHRLLRAVFGSSHFEAYSQVRAHFRWRWVITTISWKRFYSCSYKWYFWFMYCISAQLWAVKTWVEGGGGAWSLPVQPPQTAPPLISCWTRQNSPKPLSEPGLCRCSHRTGEMREKEAKTNSQMAKS